MRRKTDKLVWGALVMMLILFGANVYYLTRVAQETQRLRALSQYFFQLLEAMGAPTPHSQKTSLPADLKEACKL